MRMTLIAATLALVLPGLATAQTETATPNPATVEALDLTQWKAVFGKVEARDTVPARSRIGGTLTEVTVTEGDMVTAGQEIALIYDAKLSLQLESAEANIQALESQLANAQTELTRGEEMLSRGVTTTQRLDALRTQVDVLRNQIDSAQAQKRVVAEQAAEGAVLAPIAGKVISVPVTKGSVLMPGEAVATIGGGGFFLRLAVPERHAAFLKQGDPIQIGEAGSETTGTLAKVYPQIENGRVIADVDLPDLNSDFVDARVLVRLPVGKTRALVVPADLVVTRMGLDYVSIDEGARTALRSVVLGEPRMVEGRQMVEILSGLEAGETVVPTPDVAYAPKEASTHE
ncbi:efflux RND transporter periplasmic adaptor subunit [Rhodalgimonas zhirmunskyi]|uniref:Efflux RND transporter periplasmic adaptor subunit n=1 Tax=Rhodalgimonas zhirmunskyi TaxID=2964767 RepID=A0AAJ1X7X7_9RHOB|nr:efflux RND transporter periplasmic adaptor subunit [Rhodoalgimonas zhirmunskyi]MDQ2095017.1 efflux RND transporter periplasmic adaptor subunit [Rhodoalgimonas zhirmunskyi]